MSALAHPRLRQPAFERARGNRLPSGAMIYNNRHHTCAAWPTVVEWLDSLKTANKRPRTVVAYERELAKLLLAHPTKTVADFTSGDILSHIAAMPDRSRHIYAAPIRRFFEWCDDGDLLTGKNPTRRVPNIRYRPNRNISIFTDAEELALRSLPYPTGALMAILLDTGIRNQEARMLTVRRVNFDRQELLIREGSKGGKERVIDLLTGATAAFHDLILTDGLKPADHFWASYPGGGHKIKRDTPVTSSTFHRWWVTSLDNAGVEYRKPHTTRHTFASRLLNEGAVETDVQDMLGHDSAKTTRDVYQHQRRHGRGERLRALEAQRREFADTV